MDSRTIDGAQAVARAAQILKLVSQRAQRGHALAELVVESGLTRPTVYRLLSALQAAGLIERDSKTDRWHLGDECRVLGTLAAHRFSIERLARNCLLRIAGTTGESAFLSVRRGVESVCLIREEGTYPIRTHVLQAGDRLPLGVGSAGIAMLAALGDTEIDELMVQITPHLKRRFVNFTPHRIKQFVAQTRASGYATNKGLLLEGSWGVAAAVRDVAGAPIAALSITAIESRVQGARQVELGRLLVREARSLGNLLMSESGADPRRKVA
jgi:DNA-binding IclR family transcriptional regulator